MSGCEKYIELMNRYLDGDLPASQISDLLDHLETCASCRNRFDALKIMAFEMRHMQIEPPAALHGRIMQAAQRADQRRPRAYLKTAFAVAACAAVMALAINGNFFQMADNYLFNANKSVVMDAAEERSGEASPAQASAGAAESAPAQENETGSNSDSPMAGPYAAPEEGGARMSPPAAGDSLPEPAGGAKVDADQEAGQNNTEDVMPLDKAAPEEAFSDLPSAAAEEGAQPRLAQMESGKRAALTEEPAPDLDQPFRVPPLDTDEVFAFYCVALGEGSIPTAFDQNEIIRFPDKNCMYIYVQTTQFTKKGCENLLSQSGFTIREGSNLPETDESMPYGLIVIYGYEMN